jgi:hypothetical protein
MGDPVDSSLGMLAMEVEPPEEELAHARKHGPVTGRVSSAAAFLEPKKRLATGKDERTPLSRITHSRSQEDSGHFCISADDATVEGYVDAIHFKVGRSHTSLSFLCTQTLSTIDSIIAPNSSAAQETSNSTTTIPPLFQTTPISERKRSLSISSISGHNYSTHLADKKGLQREVKIQLLDDMESKPILEEARRASIDQQREAREDKKYLPLTSPSSSSSSSSSSSVGKATNPPERIDEENEAGEEGEGGEETVLPKEDPSIHDWDQEELKDEDLKYDEDDDDDDLDSIPSSTASLTSGNTPREETIASLQKRQRQLERDRRRAAFLSGQPTSDNDDTDSDSHSYHHDPASSAHHSIYANRDLDEDRDDPFLDPERDSAFMSEAQEADTHNVHLRLENQREFQDAAGLDLGEGEASSNVVNEDGQYGGMIEPDDEGDDFWENR